MTGDEGGSRVGERVVDRGERGMCLDSGVWRGFANLGMGRACLEW